MSDKEKTIIIGEAQRNWQGEAEHYQQVAESLEKRNRALNEEVSSLRQYKWAFEMLVKELKR